MTMKYLRNGDFIKKSWFIYLTVLETESLNNIAQVLANVP
jgi:hypothetical protein